MNFSGASAIMQDAKAAAPVVPASPATMTQFQPGSVYLGMNRQNGGLFALAPDSNFDLFVDETLVDIGFGEMRHLQSGHINRICDSALAEPTLYWRSGIARDATPVRKNVSPNWQLRDGNTAYINSISGDGEQPVSAVFHCPVEGPCLTVSPGETYTFQASFAIHRATGEIRLHFKSSTGEIIQSYTEDIESGLSSDARASYFGGPSLQRYLTRHMTVTAPADAASLTVEIVKNLTNPNEPESYLFFTRPALTRSEFISFEHLVHDLPDGWTVNAFHTPHMRLSACDMPVPDLALDGRPHKVTLKHRVGGHSSYVPVFLPASVSVSGEILALEGSVLNARVDSVSPIGVALWADGQPTGETADSAPNSGQLRIALPASLCDGRLHVLELRRTLTGQLLAEHICIGPVSTLTWQSLQNYAGMPLPAHLSPLAAFRQQSLASGVPAKTSIPRNLLHDILVEGFARPRRQFPVLPFPSVDNPDVSIIIPVHNQFDVTYVCLAAILFAATRASFEVVLVDDGSTDTTLKAGEIAPGIVIVRNEVPLGFVGACNAGAARACGRYLFFLNNDTEPTANYLDELIFAFENFEGVGLAGAKLIYPNGQLQEAGGIVWETGDPWNYGYRGNAFDPRFCYSRVCDYLSGAAIMITRGLWEELGGFSLEFMPAYFEDTDLAFKVKNAGKKVVFVPQAIVVHYEGLSNGTDTRAPLGLKRYQEVNRPKFKSQWQDHFAGNGKVGESPDLAKDRGISRRVLFLDYDGPQLDRDAGSYAAIQEIRMFQALGCKVTFAATNMLFAGRHTTLLQRLGVEVIHAPYCSGIAGFLKERGPEFDLVYITRYNVAAEVMRLVREFAPQARRIVNVADLHFLRQIRDAMSVSDPEKMAAALATRDAEIAVLGEAELILSYSPVEQTVITSHITHGPRAAVVPWVVDTVPAPPAFAARRDIAFMGGFGHSPNVAAVKYFVAEVMPLLRAKLPGVRFLIYGSKVPPEIRDLATEDIVIMGYVADVADVFASCRVFVAPLLTGAGIKGKVLDCIAAGVPAVLSPIAAEGISLRDGLDCVIARRPADWVKAIAGLYTNEAAWKAMSSSAREIARELYAFKSGVEQMREVLGSIGFVSDGKPAICATTARPVAPGHLQPEFPGEKIEAIPADSGA